MSQEIKQDILQESIQKEQQGVQSDKQEEARQNLTEMIDIKLLPADELSFSLSENGFVCLKYNGNEYKQVILARIMPFTKPYNYISVMDKERNEIGIVKDIYELNSESADIVKTELNRRYYCKQVISIISAKFKMGYLYIDAEMKNGNETIAINDTSKNIRQLAQEVGTEKLASGRILITDVDGNRYEIKDLSKMDKKSQRAIIPYLF